MRRIHGAYFCSDRREYRSSSLSRKRLWPARESVTSGTGAPPTMPRSRVPLASHTEAFTLGDTDADADALGDAGDGLTDGVGDGVGVDDGVGLYLAMRSCSSGSEPFTHV
jgi:hypothetical protein